MYVYTNIKQWKNWALEEERDAQRGDSSPLLLAKVDTLGAQRMDPSPIDRVDSSPPPFISVGRTISPSNSPSDFAVSGPQVC